MTVPDLSDYTIEQLVVVRDQANALLAAAWAVESAEERAAEVQERAAAELDRIARGWHAAHGGTGTPEEPVPWVQPSGGHDAWPLGAWVTHDGKTWESLIAANAHEPGVSGWREAASEDGPPPAWVQPSGAHDAYQPPTRVTHDGHIWECAAPNNVWPPGVHGWTDLGPLEDS